MKALPEINISKLSKIIKQATKEIFDDVNDGTCYLIGELKLSYPDFYPEKKIQIQLQVTSHKSDFINSFEIEEIVTFDVIGE